MFLRRSPCSRLYPSRVEVPAGDTIVNYTYLDATFQSGETVNAAVNSRADANGNITIQPGNRLDRCLM